MVEVVGSSPAHNIALYNISPDYEVSNFTNSTEEAPVETKYKYGTILLALFVVATLSGNVLVVLAVAKFKYLRSVTNYLIVSLAIADITVGALVMPLAVYVEVMGGKFPLHDKICDGWVAIDVLACTASIIMMTAISIDRFLAIIFPFKYNIHMKKSTKYPAIMITVSWIISFAISVPITLGANESHNRPPQICGFFNPYYSVISSTVSFVIPTVIMIVLYYKILRAIQYRATAKKERTSKKSQVLITEMREASSSEHSGGAASGSAKQGDSESKSGSRKEREDLNVIQNNNGEKVDLAKVDVDEEKGILIENGTADNYETIENSNGLQMHNATNNNNSELPTSSGPFNNRHWDENLKVEFERETAAKEKDTRSGSIFRIARNRRSRGSRKKPKAVDSKEKKAIITLLVVLCVFLVCWLPFFISNNIQVFCLYLYLDSPACAIPDMLMSVIIWLGYINSMLNPVIYAVLNEEYRKAFRQLLSYKQ